MPTAHSELNWTEFFQQRKDKSHPLWPNEAMVKIVFGGYLKNPIRLKESGQVLDVGCGFGNNLLPFLFRGWQGAGVEITPEIATQVSKNLQSRGMGANIQPGSNRHIPFPDNSFDLVLSINALHYEKDQDDIDSALDEFKRVMGKDAALVIFTTGPNHDIFRKSEQIGNNQYRIQNFDFRDGEQYFYFDSTKHLDYYMRRHFTDVEVGQVTEKLMTMSLDFLVAVCRTPLT